MSGLAPKELQNDLYTQNMMEKEWIFVYTLAQALKLPISSIYAMSGE
jgi:hypothetical protein